jgi:branched-chain amino acid transport system ATP-binding protein
MSPEEVLLSGHGIQKRYGGVIAVDSVDFDVSAGEILGLVGPNGAGKTTLVDLISGAQQADAGTLQLHGRPLKGSPSRRARRGLARTFQHPQLALSLTVAENLLVGRTARRHPSFVHMVMSGFAGVVQTQNGEDLRAVETIAAELGIDRIARRADALTWGEQRLVEVGRALCQEPEVLLLDEPFAGSDADGLAGIADVIRSLRDRGHGVILVDHNVDLVGSLVDRMMLLESGHVAFVGGAKECLASADMRRVYFGVADDSEFSVEVDAPRQHRMASDA